MATVVGSETPSQVTSPLRGRRAERNEINANDLSVAVCADLASF
jgi:hypothetical protein